VGGDERVERLDEERVDGDAARAVARAGQALEGARGRRVPLDVELEVGALHAVLGDEHGRGGDAPVAQLGDAARGLGVDARGAELEQRLGGLGHHRDAQAAALGVLDGERRQVLGKLPARARRRNQPGRRTGRW
jgi:hypothetical protein